MRRFEAVAANLILAINVLLVFLLMFQDKVVIPTWLQPVGRLHPMVLHLPIGLFLFVGLLWVCRPVFNSDGFDRIFRFLLTLVAFSAALAALMGFFLSREGGYSDQLLNWHKYTGVALSLFTYGLLLLNRSDVPVRPWFSALLSLSTAGLLVTGHFGASLTHGEDYLFPAKDEEAAVAFTADTPVFVSAIEPILKDKCYQCHNEQKQKGGLLMSSLAGLLKGGKNGPVWIAGDPLNSHLIQRANLPLDDKKHMPPKGKPQLATDDVALLTAWIQAGADTKKTLRMLDQHDPLRALAQARINPINATENQPAVHYSFDAAPAATVQKINTPFRVVVPLAYESPALQASFFVRQAFRAGDLTDLLEVKTQLVSLNLSNMPVGDEDLKTIAQFENLEKLVLNNSNITGKTFGELKRLARLRTLAVLNTKVNKDALLTLNQLPALKEVFVWSTAVSPAELAQVQQQHKAIRFDAGYVPNDSEKLKLNPPMLVNEQFVVNPQTLVRFRHPLRDVTIRYTTDGSDPDSLKGPVYQQPFGVNGITVVKARATKANWYASDPVEYTFFSARYQPLRAELLNEPNPQYQGEGGKTLIDRKKGTIDNFKDLTWLGFREKPFEALFTFDQPVPLTLVTLSIGQNTGSYIMPPTLVEIWGGADKAHLKLLQTLRPDQPLKEEPARIKALQASVKGDRYTVVKVVARPVAKLPAWHPGKGQPGWVFVDEVFFN